MEINTKILAKTLLASKKYSNFSSADFIRLGDSIKSEEKKIIVDGKLIRDVDCYAMAIYKGHSIDAYFSLGSSMNIGEKVTLANMVEYTAFDLLLMVFNHDPENASGELYFNLAVHFPVEHRFVTTREGKDMTQQYFYLKCIEKAPNMEQAYVNIAVMLPDRGPVSLDNGTQTTKVQFLRRALLFAPFCSDLYILLGLAICSNNTGMDAVGARVVQNEIEYGFVENSACVPKTNC